MSNKASTVISTASSEEGYLEKKSNYMLDDKKANAGSNNFTKYWRDIKESLQGSYWCLCFVIWCFVKAFGEAEAKSLLCMKNGFTFYTPTAGQYFYNAKKWSDKTPSIGAIIFFRSDETEKQGRWKGIHHVGIVYKVSSNTVYTIEGNTSNKKEVVPNGGCVCFKEYTIGDACIAGYGLPSYTKEQLIDILITVGRKGLKLVGTTALNIRKTPVDGEIVGTVKAGEYIYPASKTMASDGSYWFKTDKGYVSGKYFEGWIQEMNKKWWYVKQGYTYPSACIETIDGEDFAFGKDGYMLDANSFNSNGSLK